MNRKTEILFQISEWLKEYFNEQKEILKIERFSIWDNWTIESWDFFDAVHSEKINSSSQRWYIIITKKEKIYLSYEKLENIDWLNIVLNENLLNKYPKIKEIVWKIRSIESKYRGEKQIKYTDTDEKIHKILN